MKEVVIKFYGIDNFNRPVFKKIDERKFYGDTENLFFHHETKDDVLKKINPENLVYFGTAFNCEPCGLKLKKEYKFKIID